MQSTGGWFSGWFGSKQAAVEVQTVGRFPDFWHVKNSVLFVLKHCGNMMQNDNQHPGYSDELAFVYFDRCVHVDKCNLQSETETFSAVTAYMTVVGF